MQASLSLTAMLLYSISKPNVLLLLQWKIQKLRPQMFLFAPICKQTSAPISSTYFYLGLFNFRTCIWPLPPYKTSIYRSTSADASIYSRLQVELPFTFTYLHPLPVNLPWSCPLALLKAWRPSNNYRCFQMFPDLTCRQCSSFLTRTGRGYLSGVFAVYKMSGRVRCRPRLRQGLRFSCPRVPTAELNLQWRRSWA